MNNLLTRLLTKKKLTKDQLSPEEKADFQRWEVILSEGELTIDKIMNFCDAQLNIIEGQFKDLDRTEKKNERLILLHSVYKTLRNIGNATNKEKENLENYLNNLINT